LRISGPNCLGVANVKDDLWPMAMGSVVTAQDVPGAIGLVRQSGATASLRPGTTTAAVKPFRPPVARLPSLAQQTQSG